MTKTINGQLEFFSETGTEGGSYALQDEAWVHGRDVDECPWGGGRDCPAFGSFWRADEAPQHYDYRGLVMLQNGDHLTISNSVGETVWSGVVDLRRVDSYGPDGGTGGWRVHQKASNVDETLWLRWFLAGLPAVLVREDVDS